MTAANMANRRAYTCNIALGYIERRYAMARASLDSPPARLLTAA
jgi:hypothetical protein